MILDKKRNVQIIEELEGKTIVSAEFIASETWGSSKYIGLTFTDGRRLLISGSIPYKPDPSYEEMKEHPNFFSPDDMAEKVKRDEEKNRERKRREVEVEHREYEKLKEKFENVSSTLKDNKKKHVTFNGTNAYLDCKNDKSL